LIKHDEVDQSMIRYEQVDQGLSSLSHMIKVITYVQGDNIWPSGSHWWSMNKVWSGMIKCVQNWSYLLYLLMYHQVWTNLKV